MYEIVRWPADMTPSRSPIHVTNELHVPVSPETIWSLLTDPKAWPSFYPGVQHVRLQDGHESFGWHTRFQTKLSGHDFFAEVEEFEPAARIAWSGHLQVSPASKAYHAWIITPRARGCHLWTEATMQGPRWIVLAKWAPDRFWLSHEKLLKELARAALVREHSSSPDAPQKPGTPDMIDRVIWTERFNRRTSARK